MEKGILEMATGITVQVINSYHIVPRSSPNDSHGWLCDIDQKLWVSHSTSSRLISTCWCLNQVKITINSLAEKNIVFERSDPILDNQVLTHDPDIVGLALLQCQVGKLGVGILSLVGDIHGTEQQLSLIIG